MATAARPAPNGERRRSILDLAPFELDCMNALWPLGEATVKQVQASLMTRRPRAYTTIMTILDRLAQKGIVERRKVGRAYIYRANLQAAEARQSAVQHVVAGFFGGSREALAAHLTGAEASKSPSPERVRPVVQATVESLETPRAVKTETKAPDARSNGEAELDRTLL
jgi:predicted transcriptional regulator